MTSHIFSTVPDDRIASCLSNQAASDALADSVVSVSDLWILANIKATYDKEDDPQGNVPADAAAADVLPAD